MKWMQHPTNNGVLGAPAGATIDKCGALPVTHVTSDGLPIVLSYWRPDAAELTRIAAGKPVMLWIWGQTHAPVGLGVEE